MATTSPDNIWTPDATDDYALTADLATTASTVQAAITSVRNPVDRNQQFYGPTASMGSVTGMKRGDTYQESDGAFRLWRYNGSAWVLTFSHFVLRKTGSFPWTATQTDHTWDAALLEGALGAFTTTDNITYTCVVPGVYSLAGSLASDTGTASTDIFLLKNGAVVMTWHGAANGSYYMGHPFSATLRFAVGDTFKIQLGGSGGTFGLPGAGCFLAVDYISA